MKESTERRAKACEACRALKVRCIPSDPTNPSLPCVRCVKGKRECIFHMGPRKRTRKTDNRVAALEKKLEVLTAQLQGKEDLTPTSGCMTALTPVGPPPPGPPTGGYPFGYCNSPYGVPTNGTNLPMADPNQPTCSFATPLPLQPPNINGDQRPSLPPPVPRRSVGGLGDNGNGYYGPGSVSISTGASYSSPGTTGKYAKSTPSESPNFATNPAQRQIPKNQPMSLNGTPEDLDMEVKYQPTPVDTGIDIDTIREEMMQLWSKLVEKSSRRLYHLESVPLSKTQSYDNDVISQGVITEAEAEERLRVYRDRLYDYLPLVVINSDVTVEDFRREQPCLFLTIMSVASVAIEDSSKTGQSMILHNKALETVIYETMMVGTKTFELLQCLILVTFWYNDPELYHHQKNHLLTNLAISIATDLGIGGNSVNSPNSLRYDKIMRPQTLVDPRTLECRKLWLLVYCASINHSIVVRRPSFTLWGPYMDECCDLIENSDLPEQEKRIAHFARMTHIFEDISKAFYAESGGPPPDVNDTQTKFLIKFFEGKLIESFNGVPSQRRFEPYYHAIQIYLHQSVLYIPFSPDIGRAPFSEYSLAMGVLKCGTEEVKNALWCSSSCIRCLEWFSKIEPEELAVLPTFSYTRLIFATSTLLKIRSLSLSSEEFRNVCPPQESSIKLLYKVLSLLDEVTRRFPFAHCALTYGFVLRLLMVHFDRQIFYYFARKREIASEKKSSQQQQRPSQAQQQPSQPSQPSQLSQGSLPSQSSQGQPQQQLPQPQQQSQGQPPQIDNKQLLSVPQNNNTNPGSPLDMLSTVAVDNMGRPQQPQPQPQQVPMSKYGPLPNTNLNPGQEEAAEEYPYWLMGDDFWKDLVPNVEAFTGYDIM
ncbi:hypothetical protein TRVA0_010S03290 [Trichomonascus vanleenenianus]|uniref:War1p n=1 Tax=Trichomonascus vanleenenianus TaxID=2268995 RepID=UPI003ECB407C